MKKKLLLLACLMSAMAASATVISTFTGGDVGEGLDLSGDYAYAVNVAGSIPWPSTIQGKQFSSSRDDAGVSVTFGGSNVYGDWATRPEYGTSGNDGNLEALMAATALSYGAGASVEVDLDVASGTQYELQLLFSENSYQAADARHFDIAVEGATIVDEFTPGPTAWTTNPDTGVLVTYQFTAGDNVLNIDLTPGSSGDSAPLIQAVTLQVIPEPATLGLVACTAGLLLFVRRLFAIG